MSQCVCEMSDVCVCGEEGEEGEEDGRRKAERIQN